MTPGKYTCNKNWAVADLIGLSSLGTIKYIHVLPDLVEGRAKGRREAEGDVYNAVISLG